MPSNPAACRRDDVARPAALKVSYGRLDEHASQAGWATLAAFGFGAAVRSPTRIRDIHVCLPRLGEPDASERWRVAAPVVEGQQGALRWAAGGGWRITAVELDEAACPGGIDAASERAYGALLSHVAAAPESHLLRIWNYLGGINHGDGDRERYRLFCKGRARSMAVHGVTRYPAATAIGHHGPRGLLQVYALSATWPGHPMENPRQVSAWKYPRQYGPSAPGFARAMRLHDGSLAISGTAAVVGHASHHAGDAAAQTGEACANLATLLKQANLGDFDAGSPLKVYLRNADDVAAVRAELARHLDPAVPRLLLLGDICRRELLVEIDGWRFNRCG